MSGLSWESVTIYFLYYTFVLWQVQTWGHGFTHKAEPAVQDLPANARNIKGQVGLLLFATVIL